MIPSVVSHANNPARPPRRLFITDFDGTLLRPDRTLAKRDVAALRYLRKSGVASAVATGRSLYSFMHSAGADLPVDYIIFTTGAGIATHPGGDIVRKINLNADAVARAVELFTDADFDFMVHLPVPDNHRLFYRRTRRRNADFESRLAHYRQFCRPLDPTGGNRFGPAAQLLAVIPGPETSVALDTVRKGLPEMSIIHSTSPMDGQSTWLELFHPAVSKSQTAAWLASELEVVPADTMAIGNDFNDLDLLEWSGRSFVVENAPAALKGRFETVAANDACGVADAIDRWLGGKAC